MLVPLGLLGHVSRRSLTRLSLCGKIGEVIKPPRVPLERMKHATLERNAGLFPSIVPNKDIPFCDGRRWVVSANLFPNCHHEEKAGESCWNQVDFLKRFASKFRSSEAGLMGTLTQAAANSLTLGEGKRILSNVTHTRIYENEALVFGEPRKRGHHTSS